MANSGFLGLSGMVFVDFPKASAIMMSYAYDERPDMLGSYWPQSGGSCVQGKLQIIQPPAEHWKVLSMSLARMGSALVKAR